MQPQFDPWYHIRFFQVLLPKITLEHRAPNNPFLIIAHPSQWINQNQLNKKIEHWWRGEKKKRECEEKENIRHNLPKILISIFLLLLGGAVVGHMSSVQELCAQRSLLVVLQGWCAVLGLCCIQGKCHNYCPSSLVPFENFTRGAQPAVLRA